MARRSGPRPVFVLARSDGNRDALPRTLRVGLPIGGRRASFLSRALPAQSLQEEPPIVLPT